MNDQYEERYAAMKERLGSVLKGEKTTAYQSWQAPEVKGRSVNKDIVDAREAAENSEKVTAKSLEEITKQAYEEGFEKGKQAGHQAGLAIERERIQQLEALLQALRGKSESFDEQVTLQLVDLTIRIAKQIIRRELTINPDEIIAVIREAIGLIPDYAGQLTLKLHPEDAALFREIYELDKDTELSWKIFEDPSIQRGGCIISSETSEINAELDKRIQAIVSQLLGGERNDD